MRSLEQGGLVVVEPSPGDKTVHSAGYVEVEAFNDEPYADHWFEKRLGP